MQAFSGSAEQAIFCKPHYRTASRWRFSWKFLKSFYLTPQRKRLGISRIWCQKWSRTEVLYRAQVCCASWTDCDQTELTLLCKHRGIVSSVALSPMYLGGVPKTCAIASVRVLRYGYGFFFRKNLTIRSLSLIVHFHPFYHCVCLIFQMNQFR